MRQYERLSLRAVSRDQASCDWAAENKCLYCPTAPLPHCLINNIHP